jgi:CysZ protein
LNIDILVGKGGAGKMTGIIRCFLYPFRAVPLVLRDRNLLRYALIPWLINIVLFLGAIAAFAWLDKWLMAKLAQSLGTGWWVPVIAWLLGIILIVAFGTALVLSFIFIANLIGGVFFEELSRRAELIITGIDRPSPEGAFIKILMRSVIEQLKGIAFFAGIWAAMLLLYLLPGIGTAIFMVVSALWSAMGLAFEFASPAMERRAMKFREKRSLIFSKPFHALAFGSAVLLLAFIPIINLLFMPFAVVGGTIWVIEREAVNRGTHAVLPEI